MRTRALFIRIIRQMLRDRRTLFLLLFAPIFVLTLMNFIFRADVTNPKLGVVGISEELMKEIEKQDVDLVIFDEGGKDLVTTEELDGLLLQTEDDYTLFLENTDASTPKVLQMRIGQAMKQPAMKKPTMKQPELLTEYIYGDSETSLFDRISSIMIGLFIFFFVFLISGIGLLRERITGTLERLMSTPIKRYEVIFGYLLGYGFFAVLQTIVIVVYSLKVLKIDCVGSIGLVFLINFICALVALSLGILLSTFATSEFQMMQFIPIVIIPQIFFCGLFPLDGMAVWIQKLAYCMPLYYIAHALSGVMYKGFGMEEIAKDLFIVIGFSIIFIMLNIFALKKYRTL